MAYALRMEKKEKGVQLDLEGRRTEIKRWQCYFCGEEVDTEMKDLTMKSLGYVVCARCLTKLVKVVCYAGVRSVE